jgi:hypothetical protein
MFVVQVTVHWYKREGDDKLPTEKQDQLARYYATCNRGDLEAPPLPILPDCTDLEPLPLPNLPSPDGSDCGQHSND